MSKYGWERGTLKIPGSEWKRVRDEIVAAHNRHLDGMLQLAQLAYERLSAIKAAKGVAAIKGDLYEVMRTDVASAGLLRKLDSCDDAWHAVNSVRKYDPKTQRTSLVVPKKKDFAHVPPTKASSFHYGDFGISFSPKTKEVTWSVNDNNHSVERAHEHEMGRVFFRVMGSVKWVRGSGGQLVGNDEYHSEDREAGGGANYVTHRFGPLGGDVYKELGLRRPRAAPRGSQRYGMR